MSRPSSFLALFGPLSALTLAACGLEGQPDGAFDSAPDSASDLASDLATPDAAGVHLAVLPEGTRVPTAGDGDGDGSPTGTDCDDADATAYPGATEADDLVDNDCDGWVDEDFVVEGDVVVTEINRQSRFGSAVVNNNGSWVEVHNVSDRTVDLANWVLARGASAPLNQVTLDPAAAPVLAPGDYAVFCDTDDYQASATAAWPLTCDYVWGDETQASTYVGTYHDNTFWLRRDSDRVALYVGGSRTTGTEIDAVRWYYDATNGYWPRNARFSMSLDPTYHNGVDNDSIDVWCSTSSSTTGSVSYDSAWRWYDVARTSYDEYGTPGAANYDCPNDPDLDGDGYTGTDDCDETDAAINPGATETCDGVDQDCDGLVDDGTAGSTWYPDTDADGYGDAGFGVTACVLPASDYVADATDCDDSTADSYPGATEICDELDNDCDGSVDEETTGSNVFFADTDGDGYGDADATSTSCTAPAGYVDNDSDCDDADAAVSPDGAEGDNLADDDCDGWVDEDFVAVGDVIVTEFNRQAWFGGTVIVNNGSWVEVHNTSARTIDLSNWVLSRGHSAPYNQVTLDPAAAPLLAPGDYAVFCDSDDYEASAGAAWPLTCDYVWGDEAEAASYVGEYHDNTFYIRRDSDTVALYVGGSRTTGTKIDSVKWTYDATNGYWPRNARFSTSLDPAYFDGALNDGIGAWCSTASNSAGTPTNNTAWRWYDTATTANDEHGTPGAANYDCLTDPDVDGDGYVASADCDDTDAGINPGAVETCNDVDDDCDGTVDDGASDSSQWYADADGDGYGDALVVDEACDQPAGYVTDATDCDDTSASVSPAGTETCNDVDDDCDGAIDDDPSDGDPWYTDADGDGYGDDASEVLACDMPAGTIGTGGDCDDADAAINPLAAETCDGVDEDCDGTADDGAPGSNTYYADADGDGYGDAGSTTTSCAAPSGYVADATDCDDAASTTNPGAAEVCNDAVDNDCDPDPTTCEWSGSQTVKYEYDFRAYGTAANYAVGHAVANNGDFDGDGYDDVLVGQAYHDEGAVADAGRTLLWYGPVDTSDELATADVSIVGGTTVANDQFGWQARFAGDVDGDGLDDILASAWKAETNDRGAAYLFVGGTTPTSVSDAYASFGPSDASNYAGQAIDGADIDGDGRADVLVSAYGRSSSAGAVAVWDAGSVGGAEDLATDATLLVSSGTAGENLGYAAVFAPDLDGDGLSDLVVGGPATASTSTPGAVYVFYGVDALSGSISPSAADATLSGSTNGDRFGLAVAGLGDTDGDGQNDFAVTADKEDSAATDAGAVYLFTTAPTGSATGASVATSTIRGGAANDFFGRSLAGVGDVNADGLADVFVGATGYDDGALSGAGAVYLWYGPVSAGTSSASGYDFRMTGANTADAVGYAVSGGGDVNADGYADYMTSAPSWDGFGYLNSGGAWLYYGRGE